VTPEQAHVIELAGKMGNPRFVLRGSTDLTPTPEGGATLAQLRTANNKGQGQNGWAKMLTGFFGPNKPGEQDANGATPDPAKGWTVQVIRAGVESQVIIPVKPEDPSAKGPAAKPEATPAPGVVQNDLSPVADPRTK
jgi:hypothetical protein